MPAVTYAGSREELIGQKFDVPAGILQQASGNSVAEFIERKVDSDSAIEAAETEATTRRQQSLAARMEAERLEVEATIEATAQAAGQATRDAEFRVELSDPSLSVQQAGAAIVGKADVIETAYGQWADRHETIVSASEAAVERAQAQVTFAQAVSQESDDALKAHISQQQTRIGQLEEELRATVLQLQGPQGDRGERGIAGSGIGYVDGNPQQIDQASLGQRFFGRAVVPGDLLLERTADSLKVWRTAEGRNWTQVDEILNRQELISSRLNVLDQSTKVQSTTTVQKFGGGSGSEPFAVRSINGTVGSSALVGDGSKFSSDLETLGAYCTAAKLIYSVTAADGPEVGQSAYATVDLLLDNPAPTGADYTISSELGSLGVSLDFTFTNGAGRLASWAPTGALVSATHAPLIQATVTANSSGATNLIVSGSVIFALPTKTTGQPLVGAW